MVDLISLRADISQLALEWQRAKENETDCIQERREVEDELTRLLEVNSAHEGTVNFELDGYEIKIVSRLNRKIDPDLLQEIAAEHDLSAHLSSLFRWKPELDMKSWKSADKEITNKLLAAITTTAGRPSYSITKE